MFQFPSIDRIEAVKVPTLFLSGAMDELVPPKMMKDLYNVSNDWLILSVLVSVHIIGCSLMYWNTIKSLQKWEKMQSKK